MEMKNSFMVRTGTAVTVVLLLLRSCSCAPASAAPAPAPAAPEYVNLTYLLSVAGPFHTFLNYLDTTKVIDTFQNLANNTAEGITIFVPKDQSFTTTNNKKQLSNLTNDQLKSLCLFHALPHYYTFSDFTNLSRHNPVSTLAGTNPLYSLNLTDNSGTILISSGWTSTKVSSAVHAANPVAIYQVDSVLLPEAIFGTSIPPTPAPAPAPAPDIAADADTNHTRGGGSSSSSDSSSPTSTPSSSSHRISNLGVLGRHLITSAAIVGGGGLLLMFWF